MHFLQELHIAPNALDDRNIHLYSLFWVDDIVQTFPICKKYH